MSRFDIKTVKAAAEGRWDAIFSALAPQLAPAQERVGRHVPCPVHGGTDGFRLFKHYAAKGDGICNTCGAKTDGFDMLCWVNGWTFAQALTAVGNFLGLKPEASENRSSHSHATRSTTADLPPQPGEALRFEGVVVFAGTKPYKDTGRKAYGVELLSANGMKRTCWGKELETALKAAGASRGDRVSLVKVRTEERRGSKGAYLVNVWDCLLIRESDRKARGFKKKESTSVCDVGTETAPSAKDLSPRHEAVEKLWGIALPIRKDRDASAPALKYLERLGLKDARWDDETLRFVPNAIYRVREDKTTERWPAMVAAVRKVDGSLVTLHRTFLTEEGTKAPVEEVKKLMVLPEGETINGASIQLGKPLDKLCVAEGIETALSVQYATGIPCWCAISANGLKTVEIPAGVRTVLIFADKDKSETGALAAEALRKRLADEGRLAVIVNIPDAIPSGSKGIDWNDVLMLKGPDAFPVRDKQLSPANR